MYATTIAEVARLHRVDMLSDAARYRRGADARRSRKAASGPEPILRRRRASAARFVIRAGLVGVIVVAAFLARDGRDGADTFLGLQGTLALAAALSLAAAGGALVTLTVAARSRRQNDR